MRARMTLTFLAIVLPVVVLGVWGFLAYSDHVTEADNRRLLFEVARDGADQMKYPNWEQRLTNLMATRRIRERGIIMAVFDRDFNIVWHMKDLNPPFPKRGDRSWRIGGTRAGDYFIGTARSWRGVLADRTDFERDVILSAALIVIVLSVGAWLLVGRTLMPIRALARQASEASTDRLQVQLSPPSQDAEVTYLVETMNGLLGRIAETAAAKGRFYAAASHELRTPLQALSAHLEVSLSRERKAPEYEGALAEASRQTQRLVSLVQSLLLLHQLDADTVELKEEMDLGVVCRDALSSLDVLIDTKGLKLEKDLAGECLAKSAASHVQVLIRNVLENAVKYADRAGKVSVVLSNAPRGPVLDVFNECHPADDWDTSRLFEPFYRPDSSRNSRTGGNGLGLAICKAVCDTNGWKISLAREDGGVRTRVEFERRPDATGPRMKAKAAMPRKGRPVLD